MKDLEPSAKKRNEEREEKQCIRWDTEPKFQKEVNACVLAATINTACLFGKARNLPEKEILAILKKRYHLRGRVVGIAFGALEEQGLVRSEQGKAGRTYIPEFSPPRVDL